MKKNKDFQWSAKSAQELQYAFDASRGFVDLPFRPAASSASRNKKFQTNPNRDWSAFVKKLEFGTLGALGELGEFADWLKKWSREAGMGRFSRPDIDSMAAELADIYSYLLKLGNIIDRDVDQLHAAGVLRNLVRFPQVSSRGTPHLISIAGPTCAGKTTTVKHLANSLCKFFPAIFIEHFERNPHLKRALLSSRKWDSNQKWFLRQYDRFFLLAAAKRNQSLLLDQEPSAVSLVYGHVLLQRGWLTSDQFSTHLRYQLEIEEKIMRRRAQRTVLFLDADEEVLYQRVQRRGSKSFPKSAIHQIRSRFHKVYDGLVNVKYLDTSRMSIEEMTAAAHALVRDSLRH